MKKVLSFVAVLFAVVAVNAQNFTENFDEGGIPANWTMIDNDGDDNVWENSIDLMGEGYGYNGSAGCVLSKSYDNNFGALTPDNYLITPQIALGAGATLTFAVTGQDASWCNEHYSVLVSTTDASVSSFTTVFEETFQNGAKDQAPWQVKTVDLSSYAGQTVYIAFRHHDVTDMFYLDIDEVTVTGNTTGIEENNAAQVSIFPNPATSVLNVNAEGYNTIQIINLLGEVVYSANAESNMQINVRNLTNGAYFVRMIGANGTATQKFIKK